jgi:hypothetical protein
MGKFDILEKAINKAKEKGAELNVDWNYEKGKIIDGTNYYAIIFRHDFLKAIWGEDVQFLQASPVHSHIGANCVLWEWHAKQMLVSEDPVKYLEKNLDKDNWKKVSER